MAVVGDEPNYLSASEALQHFSSGRLSPVELLNPVLQRAENIAGSVNPLADRYFDQARQAAKESEARYSKGNPRRLEGIPPLIKDSVVIEGTKER